MVDGRQARTTTPQMEVEMSFDLPTRRRAVLLARSAGLALAVLLAPIALGPGSGLALADTMHNSDGIDTQVSSSPDTGTPGADDPANHDANDAQGADAGASADNAGGPGANDPASHDATDDHGGSASGASGASGDNSGSGNGGSGDNSGSGSGSSGNSASGTHDGSSGSNGGQGSNGDGGSGHGGESGHGSGGGDS